MWPKHQSNHTTLHTAQLLCKVCISMQHSGYKGLVKSKQKQILEEFKKQVLPMEVVQIYSQLHND